MNNVFEVSVGSRITLCDDIVCFLTLVVSVFKIESPASSGVEQNAVCEKCFVANETSPDIPTT